MATQQSLDEMQSFPQTSSFGGGTGKNFIGNVVVPMASSDGQLDAAEGGTSTYAFKSPVQSGRLGMRSLRLNNSGNSEASPDILDVSMSRGGSILDDFSASYGKQQCRLTAQLAAKQRRPSNLQLTLQLDGGEPGAEEAGPWGLLKKDRQSPSWSHRMKWHLTWLSRKLLVKPGNPKLQIWFYFCVAMTVISGWEVPFHFAFVESGGVLRPYNDWVAVIEIMSTCVFFLDFLLRFNVVYIDTDSGVMVASRKKIAVRYIHSWQFCMDFVGWFPLDWILIDTMASYGATQRTLVWLAWLKMLTLVRMYRVFQLFADLDYRMVLSQGALMLTRNYTYVVFTTHWAACILYHIAAHQSFSPTSWVGRNAERFTRQETGELQPVHVRYLLSLYFSTSAFTGLGDAALFAASVPEAAFMILYLLFNLFLGAYILGTVTMLVVKGDERSKAFRERMSNLNEFSRNNDIPERLQTAMQEHLEVTFNTEQVDDEHVLGIYPTTIRRKVLRHLYMHPVRTCYLFRGCKQRFLDALLTVARVELFMPGVQLLIEGDNVTELNIIVSGDVLVAEAGINLSAAFSQFASTDASNRSHRRRSSGGSFHGGNEGSTSLGRTLSSGKGGSIGRNSSCNGSIKDFLMDGSNGFMEMATGKKVITRHSGEALADVSFFTDVPSNETIMSQSVMRVLSIPKAAWEDLMDQFPQQARLVLTNLQAQTEAALSSELLMAANEAGLSEEQLRTALQHGRGAKHKALFKQEESQPLDLTELLAQATIDFLHRLDDVRAIVRAHVRKVDQLRTFDFLGSASDGDTEMLRTMLNQGMNPNSADYDGRTALMLASSGGHEAVVRLLLDSGAKSDQLDAFGNSAMCEAVKNAHDNVIDVLLSYGATLAMEAMAVASVMCTAVFEGDLVKLRRLLRSGAPPDACDYDKRSALHIAGAEGNLAAVKLLIEEGGADPNFQDRWGNTAFDEARRVGATPVVAYLEGLVGSDKLLGSGIRYRQQVATDFLLACGTGDVARVRYITHNSHPGCIFTGFVLAATKGFKDVAEVLLSWVPSDLLACEGHMALVGAARMGHSAVVGALRAAGLKLSDPRDGSLMSQLRAAILDVDLRAVAALLTAGVDVRVADGSGLLHSAAATGSLELVRRLVECGCMRPNAEDSAGKTPGAVAEAAKLTAVADYLRWASSVFTSVCGSYGPPPTKVSLSGGMAMQNTAPPSLAAAAEARFGPLPDYSNKETHDEASHGIIAVDAMSSTDDDGEAPPLLLAKMGSFGGSSRRLPTMGALQRQPSMAARSSMMWRLTSMARMSAVKDLPDEPGSPEYEEGNNAGEGKLGSRGDGGSANGAALAASAAGATAAPQRQARRASLTNFLTTHRHPDLEMDFAAFLAAPSFSGLSISAPSASMPSVSNMHKRKSSATGMVTSGGSKTTVSASITGGGDGRGDGTSKAGEVSDLRGKPKGLTDRSMEVAGLAECGLLVADRSAVSLSLPATGPTVAEFVIHGSAQSLSTGAAGVRGGGSQELGAPPPLRGPGGTASYHPIAATVSANPGSPTDTAASAAFGGAHENSLSSTTPGGLSDAKNGGGGSNSVTSQCSVARKGQRVATVIDVKEDSLQTLMKGTQSDMSGSNPPQPPPPQLSQPQQPEDGTDDLTGDSSRELSAVLRSLGAHQMQGTLAGTLPQGELSHRALEKQLTALSPPGR